MERWIHWRTLAGCDWLQQPVRGPHWGELGLRSEDSWLLQSFEESVGHSPDKVATLRCHMRFLALLE